MKSCPEIAMNEIVPVLSLSPMEEDHFFLQDIFNRLQGRLDPSRTFKVNSCATLASTVLPRHQFGVVVCEWVFSDAVLQPTH